ncbi:MAG: hypothetical protein NTV34_11340, partial [Proteobacteria bacterium]|nr:hypothetical protein [Pseudomonadota bacterium]
MNFYGQRKLEFCLKIFVLLSLAGVTSHCKSRELGESSAKSKGLADNSDLFEVIFEKDVGQFDSYVEKHISIDQVSQKAASIISSDCGRYNYADPGRNRLPYNPAKTDINGDAESGMSA